ncbi:hypothetical protein OC846_001585 [Tilletia horrida]|uniref:Uncharacterized protein n=1 Tax=Tilletia horrida TaxID=155126 RepID=A0AAN6GSP1_9BASI|nr:hypothetical protein OC846_001585 [Tilletia horrida]KAK0569491.1 hypothetical protein OC861_000864 [Tilletia horrida]
MPVASHPSPAHVWSNRDLDPRQSLVLEPAIEPANGIGPAIPPENAGQILSSMEVQNSPTPVLLPSDLFSELFGGPTPLLSASGPFATATPAPSPSTKANSSAQAQSDARVATDDDGSSFKIAYLTPLFVLIGLLLIFSVGGKIWGSAWRSKQREMRRRRKHHQTLDRDTEHQALDPDLSADGPHAVMSDDEEVDDVFPKRKRIRERRSEQNLVPDDGTTGMLHAFGARILGTKGKLIPPTTRDRAGNKYSMPVQSNAWWKVHVQRAMSRPDLQDETDEPMMQTTLYPVVTVERKATVLSTSTVMTPSIRSPSDTPRCKSPTKYEPDSPTRAARPGTSYFPFAEDDAGSIIVHSPPASPTKEDEPIRWHCRSAISSTTRGSSIDRSDTIDSKRSWHSPGRRPTQRRNTSRRQDSIVEVEPIIEPTPARLPAELRIGVNASLNHAQDKAGIATPSSPTKRQMDRSLFIEVPTSETYGLQAPFEIKSALSSSSPSASRTNSERSGRSTGTTTSEGQTSVTTASSGRSSPQRRAALARRSPGKSRHERQSPSKTEHHMEFVGHDDGTATDLTRALTSPPIRGYELEDDNNNPFKSTECSPRRARTADSPSGAQSSGKKIRTPAEKFRERRAALQSAQVMIDQGLLFRSIEVPP